MGSRYHHEVYLVPAAGKPLWCRAGTFLSANDAVLHVKKQDRVTERPRRVVGDDGICYAKNDAARKLEEK